MTSIKDGGVMSPQIFLLFVLVFSGPRILILPEDPSGLSFPPLLFKLVVVVVLSSRLTD